MPELKPQATDPKLWNTPQPAESPDRRRLVDSSEKAGRLEAAKEREARLQREREERGEDQKVRNRLHWEEMRRAAQDGSGQSEEVT